MTFYGNFNITAKKSDFLYYMANEILCRNCRKKLHEKEKLFDTMSAIAKLQLCFVEDERATVR